MICKRQTTISREGWYFLFVLFFVISGALLRDINLLMVVAGMMLGPFLYNWHLVVSMLRDIEVRRSLPEGICAGDTLNVSITLSGKGKQTGWSILVEDQIAEQTRPNGELSAASLLFPRLPPGESMQQTYHGRLMHRGQYLFPLLKVSTAFPLGLLRRTLKFDSEQTLFVYPKLGRMTRQWTQMRAAAPLGTRRVSARQGAMEGDFFAMRDWRPGDSRRWIHWRTSARRGNLTVRQFEQQRNEDLVLIVDLWAPADGAPVELEQIETAISLAATAVEDLCRRGGSQLVLAVAGQAPFLVHGQGSMGLLADAMQQLAVAQPGTTDSLAEMVEQAMQHASSGATVALVSIRDVAWNDPRRFSKLSESTATEISQRKAFSLNVADPQIADYFEQAP